MARRANEMEQIHLVPYDPTWPERYRAEALLVRSCLMDRLQRIEHMGSTAVPGLAAKPVIDIIVLVKDLADARAAIPALEAQGYAFWADNPDTTRLYLVKGLPPSPHRTHHLHIHDDEDEVQRHLLFRDHLRDHPEVRDAYLRLKQELAIRYHDDREAYTRNKTDFVDMVVLALGGPPRRVTSPS
ncbi:GrpB family protein [Devosia algicola]|uniref:GrpB family protein n=1 Tax=Devosia algicola TaxID=3026418 RepID=A0ABY7YLA9_9HYPH|nr:GrpB family protein [Devosia algicola]WDR02093.1 GrpB family protein [Devosia algicola]